MLQAARARRQNQSGWLTQSTRLLGAGLRDTNPILPSAFGDRLSFNDARAAVAVAVVDPLVRPRLAHIIASAWAQRININNADMEQARMIGELTVGWVSDYPDNQAGTTAAQNTLLNLLRSSIIERATLLVVVRNIVARCRAARNTGTVPAAEFEVYAPAGGLANISKVFYEFVIFGGHLILNDFLCDTDNLGNNTSSRDLWATLKGFAQADPVIPDGDPDLIVDVQPPYAGQNLTQMMGFWECIEYYNSDLAKKRILGAAAVFVTAACKGGNETEAYLARRLAIFDTNFPGLDIQGIYKSEVIKAFCDIYMGQDIAVNTLYKALMPVYSAYGGTKLQCLAWMIEQAVGHNCTSVVAFAEATIEQNYRPLQILLQRLSPRQWQNFVSMCYVIIRNPWGQIRTPRFPASTYKDLTNYGRYARKKQDSKFAPYAGSFLPGGELTERQIKTIYDACKEQADMIANSELNLATELRALLPSVEVRVEDEEVYLYDGTDTPLNLGDLIERANAIELAQRANVVGERGEEQAAQGIAQLNVDDQNAQARANIAHGVNPFVDGGAQDLGAVGPAAYGLGQQMDLNEEEREQLREVERRRMAALRADWSGRMKNLPKSAIRLNMAEVMNVIQRRLAVDPRYNGLRDLLSQVRAAVSQEVLTPWTGDNQISLTTRYRPASQSIRNTLLVFGVNPQDVIPDNPDDDVVEPATDYDAATMDVDPMWTRPQRAAV